MISCLSGGFSRWLSYLWLMIEAHHLKCVLQWWKQNIWKCRTISCKFMIHVGSSSSQLGKSTWRKMAETLFCIKRDFFFLMSQIKQKEKRIQGEEMQQERYLLKSLHLVILETCIKLLCFWCNGALQKSSCDFFHCLHSILDCFEGPGREDM